MKLFQNNLKFLREKTGISQAELALRLKKGRTSISSWEISGVEPSYSDLNIIVNFFGVSIDEFINTDLSKGNLNEKSVSKKIREKGNLKGNPIGNPNRKEYPENDHLSVVTDDDEQSSASLENYKDKYLALLEKTALDNTIVHGLAKRLQASETTLSALREFVLKHSVGAGYSSEQEANAALSSIVVNHSKARKMGTISGDGT